MKKIKDWSSTNPCGRKTVVKKHRVKAMDGDWDALKQKLRLSVLPAHGRNSPTQNKSYRKEVADSLIGPRSRPRSAKNHSLVSLQSCVFRLFARSCHLRKQQPISTVLRRCGSKRGKLERCAKVGLNQSSVSCNARAILDRLFRRQSLGHIAEGQPPTERTT